MDTRYYVVYYFRGLSGLLSFQEFYSHQFTVSLNAIVISRSSNTLIYILKPGFFPVWRIARSGIPVLYCHHRTRRGCPSDWNLSRKSHSTRVPVTSGHHLCSSYVVGRIGIQYTRKGSPEWTSARREIQPFPGAALRAKIPYSHPILHVPLRIPWKIALFSRQRFDYFNGCMHVRGRTGIEPEQVTPTGVVDHRKCGSYPTTGKKRFRHD